MHVVVIGTTLYLVVAGDGNVDVPEGGVCVTESNHRDVHIGSLSHRLVVNAWVSHNQQAWLTVGSLNMEEEKKAGPTPNLPLSNTSEPFPFVDASTI